MTKPTLLLPLLVLFACDGAEPLPGQFGEDEDTVCVRASTEPVAADAIVTIGWTDEERVQVVVADVVAAVGSRDATLTWSVDSAQTAVHFAGSGASAGAELVHYEPASEEIPASMCGSGLAFPLTGTLTTDDGRLDETLSATAASFGEGVYVDLTVASPSGSIDPVALAVGSEGVEPEAIEVHLVISDDAVIPFSGSISPVRLDDPNEDVAPLGSWPGELEE